MNYLRKGLHRTFHSLRQHKLLFFIALILQIALIVAVVYVGLTYQLKILENAQYILQAMEGAQYNTESLQQGQPFLNDYLQLYQQYRALIANVLQLAVWLGSLFLGGMLLLWLLTHQILAPPVQPWGKRLKQVAVEAVKIVVALFVFLIPVLALGYWRLKELATQPDPEAIIGVLKMLGYVFIVAYYLLLVALAQVHHPWKLWVHNFFAVGIKNIHKTVLVLLINAALIFGSLYLVYLSMQLEEWFSLLLLSSILVIILLVLTRLFWMACLQEIVRSMCIAPRGQRGLGIIGSPTGSARFDSSFTATRAPRASYAHTVREKHEKSPP